MILQRNPQIIELEKDDEFVATEPGHRISFPNRAPEALRDLLKQFVPGIMAVGVVDVVVRAADVLPVVRRGAEAEHAGEVGQQAGNRQLVRDGHVAVQRDRRAIE